MRSRRQSDMDVELNPLSHLSPAQRSRAIVSLGIMWIAACCVGAVAWLWSGELVILPVLVGIGVMLMGLTCYRVGQVAKYLDYSRKDGAACYDAVRGA